MGIRPKGSNRVRNRHSILVPRRSAKHPRPKSSPGAQPIQRATLDAHPKTLPPTAVCREPNPLHLPLAGRVPERYP